MEIVEWHVCHLYLLFQANLVPVACLPYRLGKNGAWVLGINDEQYLFSQKSFKTVSDMNWEFRLGCYEKHDRKTWDTSDVFK